MPASIYGSVSFLPCFILTQPKAMSTISIRSMIDIVFISAPFTKTDMPLSSIAMLGGMLKTHGLDYRFIDINAEINSDIEKYQPIIRFCRDSYDVINAKQIADHITTTAKRALSVKSQWIGISLFCFQGQNYTRLLCQEIKLQDPDAKIILGGPGIITDGLNGTQNIAEELISLGLADHYIRGEADISLVKFLSKQDYRDEQILDLDALAYSDYDQYDLNLYKEKRLGIVGSRGCVRKCTFCDIHKHWRSYVYRSGSSIAQEMIHNSQRYGVRDYRFADSLVNGSMLAYRDMVNCLTEHNSIKSDEKLTWQGQFIFRPKHQMTSNDWLLTKSSGADTLYVGVESMIDHVRHHMGKKFSNDDVFHGLDACLDLGINVKFLMIVGYVTESEQDHIDEMRLYERLSSYSEILKVTLGTTLGILPGTPLHDSHDTLRIKLGEHENDWINEHGNYKDRLRRRNERKTVLESLGLNDSSGHEQDWL